MRAPSPRRQADLIVRNVWGSEVFNWPPERRSIIKRMHTRGVNEALVTGMLPPNLTQLTLGDSFNHHLDAGVLPPNLAQLTLGNSFNHPLDAGVLSPNLVQLTFGDSFDQPLDADVLPPNLVQLTGSFSRSIRLYNVK